MTIKFDIDNSNEHLNSHTGLALIGALLHGTKINERLSNIHFPQHPRPEISHGDIAQSMIGLLCLGKPDFEAIEAFRDDQFFSLALHLDTVPSEGTLRQRLNDAKGSFNRILKEESAEMIKRHAPRLTPCLRDLVALDIDVSPFDNSRTKKEGVSCTYKKVDGFAPIFAYLGEEGYLLNTELREGKQHCQKGTPEFLRETLDLVKLVTGAPILTRLDAGNDSIENIGICQEKNAHWIIKHNLRKESPDAWLEIARQHGQASFPRPGKIVYRGAIETCAEDLKPWRQVFEITQRTIDAEGQHLLVPEIEVDVYETSLPDAPETIIGLYHAHGTSEQFHSEIKSDMNLERLPSGKFETNALVLLLALVAYNCLRLCGQESLREEGVTPQERAPIRKRVSRRRLRSVIQDLIYMASRLTRHARRWGLSFSRWNPWYGVWRRIYLRFAQACP